ncbi:B-cell receptor-associated protein 31 isoform X2 [Aplysia californica]|uniref:Endoplasmic reticulum transmembrane protein n=1 Tax=Aplysia californica TaxID=6500 RepID=A0ABM0JD56_APLCA|nr:B-cell receptor-associated protein 31 isoform X2 [Aplysia californica]
MTLQWTFVATVLYVEIFLVSVLLLPFISPKTWQKVFRSRLASMFAVYSKIYFYIFIAILLLLFAESIREVKKYSDPLEVADVKHGQAAETFHHMKLFRAQRNLYISGMALFLWFILRRLVILIANEATLMAQSEASIKQAQSATAAAQLLIEEKSLTDDNKKNSAAEKGDEKGGKSDQTVVEKDLARTQTELEKTKEELYKAQVDFESMKKQAESTNKEYDRLLLEHEKLQNKLASVEGEGDKKGN